jgi:hypothetical protein
LSTDSRAEVTGEDGLDAGANVGVAAVMAFDLEIAVGCIVCSGVVVGLPQPTARDTIIEKQTHSQDSLPDLIAS